MVERLDSLGDNPERYRIIMVTPVDDFGKDWYRRPLYEKIAKAMEDKRLRTFLPHKEIKDDWDGPKINMNLMNILVYADLAIADIGVNEKGNSSAEVGQMTMMANSTCTLLVGFYEKGKRAPDAFPLTIEIEYGTEGELVEKLLAFTEPLR